MGHGKQVHLVFHAARYLGGVYFQRLVHKHFVVSAVRPPVFGYHKPIPVFSEVHLADNLIQFIPLFICAFNGAAYFINKVLFKEIHRLFCLFVSLLIKRGQIPVLQMGEQFVIGLIRPFLR